MYISRLVIRNFRNFKHLDVELNAGLTCIVGENNSGKTNLLYAIRLALDANLPAFRRQLSKEDFHQGLDITQPQQILIGVQFKDFSADEDEKKIKEHALAQEWVVGDDLAQVCYRFLPKVEVRERHEEGSAINDLTIDSYEWELVAGPVTDDNGNEIDLSNIEWMHRFNSFVKFNRLSAFRVEYLHPIRDVEEDLKRYSTSPLLRLLEAQDIPEEEKNKLIDTLKAVNKEVAEQDDIKSLASTIDAAFENAVGPVFKLAVSLGMAPPTFRGIVHSLTLLLTDSGMAEVDPSRNGLGLNNALYIAMLLKYFQIRSESKDTAGQVLLIEEPEAHLHPQLQRVIFGRLLSKDCQVIASSHSTHITSRAPLANLLILTREPVARTSVTCPSAITGLEEEDVADLERYLDATKSVLLYAKRVMLVEGMSEMFLIPVLLKVLKGIDIEEQGISIVPIHGVHFSCYMRLFGPDAIRKKCAVVTDGDPRPSDSGNDGDSEEQDEVLFLRVDQLQKFENDFVRVFPGQTTFERDVADVANLRMFAEAARNLGASRTADSLMKIYKRRDNLGNGEKEEARDTVLRIALRFGKARFAQVCARYAKYAEMVPNYIIDSVKWLK